LVYTKNDLGEKKESWFRARAGFERELVSSEKKRERERAGFVLKEQFFHPPKKTGKKRV